MWSTDFWPQLRYTQNYQNTHSSIMKKLENKVAVITGGTSGMALATAKLFVEHGAYVLIIGRDKADWIRR